MTGPDRPDRGLMIFTMAVCAIMLLLLVLVTGVHVETYYMVEQRHTIDGSTALSGHPRIVVTSGTEDASMKIDIADELRLTPYDSANGTVRWMAPPAAGDSEYVCMLVYRPGYTGYLFGVPIARGEVPGSERQWTIVDARGPAGQWNTVRVPEYVRLSQYNRSLPTYRE
jgi:hypothetical protein